MNGSPIIPYTPPISPYALPHEAFDAIIDAYGVRLQWRQGHLCPCTFASDLPGSPLPDCNTCSGYGTYWDRPACAPFQGLITFMHLSPSPDEPGAIMDSRFGTIQRAEPTLSIPVTAGLPWEKATLNDIFIQLDAIDRYNAQLQVGGVTSVPYQEGLCIPTSGAVTAYNTETKTIIPVSGYAVSGAVVTLPSGYASGTPYIVEFTAAKVFVAWRESGATPHDRPFGQVQEPKRFRLQTLDLWLRGQHR